MKSAKNLDSDLVASVGVNALVGLFQCPGCACGSDTDCGRYQYDPAEFRCVSHVLGTHIGLGNPVALGMPKGFNKPGWTQDGHARNKIDIRLHPAGTYPSWNNLNVSVWALEKDGFLFVRTFAPRMNFTWIDVIEGGTLSLCPAAINVADFIDEID